MKKHLFHGKSRLSQLACALPLMAAAAGFLMAPLPSHAQATQAVTTSSTPQAASIARAKLINPTTVQVDYSDGHILYIDFYGDNIFRLFRDDNGGIIRDPEATPPAKILVSSEPHSE